MKIQNTGRLLTIVFLAVIGSQTVRAQAAAPGPTKLASFTMSPAGGSALAKSRVYCYWPLPTAVKKSFAATYDLTAFVSCSAGGLNNYGFHQVQTNGNITGKDSFTVVNSSWAIASANGSSADANFHDEGESFSEYDFSVPAMDPTAPGASPGATAHFHIHFSITATESSGGQMARSSASFELIGKSSGIVYAAESEGSGDYEVCVPLVFGTQLSILTDSDAWATASALPLHPAKASAKGMVQVGIAGASSNQGCDHLTVTEAGGTESIGQRKRNN